jgi:hypothetical protein
MAIEKRDLSAPPSGVGSERAVGLVAALGSLPLETRIGVKLELDRGTSISEAIRRVLGIMPPEGK